jgi:hypothetical protein
VKTNNTESATVAITIRLVFGICECDTDRCLAVAKVTEILAVSKQTTHRLHIERLHFKKVNEGADKERYWDEI